MHMLITASTSSASEVARLSKLAEYQILDTAPEAEFDEIVQVAAKLLGTPISTVTLIDKDRQWFKARYGVTGTETPRNQAFCAHAIEGDDLYIVNNAAEDPLFADNPLVTGAPNIRFYAGAPLITPDKFRLGTLCVIDDKPHDGLDAEQQRILTLLARVVVNLMESRRASLRAAHQAKMMTQLAERTVAITQAKDATQLAKLLTQSARAIVVADAAYLRICAAESCPEGTLDTISVSTREGNTDTAPTTVPWQERGVFLAARAKLAPASTKDLPPESHVKEVKGSWIGFIFGLDPKMPLGDFQVWRQYTTSFTDLETAILTDLVRVAGAVGERLGIR